IFMGYKAAALIAGVVLAILIRKVPNQLIDTKFVSLAVYVLSVTMVILFPLGVLLRTFQEAVVIIGGMGTFLAFTLVLLILFFSSIIRICQRKPPITWKGGATGGAENSQQMSYVASMNDDRP